MIRRKKVSRQAPRVRCAFRIAAEGMTPDEISEILSLHRDGGQVLRDEIAAMSFEADRSVCSWYIRSRNDPRAPASEHLFDLLGRLEPRTPQLQQLLNAGALADIQVAILANEFAVPFTMSPDLMKRLAELNVELDVYFTPEVTWDEMIAHVGE